jgi:23S rRNA (uridine2552-2'-O)-methyltransferase
MQVCKEKVGQRGVGVILSDMAPNLSGIEAVDQARAVYLGELALDFAQQVLKPGGAFLVKLFQGAGFEGYLAHLKTLFRSVVTRKPKASRPESREIYLLAKQYHPPSQLRG